MMETAKKKTRMRVLENRELAEGIYSLLAQYEKGQAPGEVRPGQFAGLFPPDPACMLMRPISICEWRRDLSALRFVYRAGGKGTRSLAGLKRGDEVSMLGILGNGYDTGSMAGKDVLLMGGGIGIPPMLELAKALTSLPGTRVKALMGYRNEELFLFEDFQKVCEAYAATDDGSAGFSGTVTDAARALSLSADVICACGPMPMLRAVAGLAEEMDAECFISLEERMACGVGACLGCVAKTREVDGHSHVKNARVCTEGPVFRARDVEI